MVSSPLLSLPDGFVIDLVGVLYECVTICIHSTAPAAVCPLCSKPTTRIHSRYRRTVADLPSAGRKLVLSLLVRKFFCQTSDCSRRIFAERFPDIVRPWARMTQRLGAALEAVGCSAGGGWVRHQCRGRSSPRHTLGYAHLSGNHPSTAQSRFRTSF
jgi:transposase